MISRVRTIWVCLAVLALFHAAGGASRTAAQGAKILGPFVDRPVAAVPFDGDVRALPQTPPTDKRIWSRPRRGREYPLAQPDTMLDSVRQAAPDAASMPTPSQSFKGIDFNTSRAGWPPDTNGDVGPNHYIQTVNISIGIYNKSGTRLALFTFDSFFSSVGNNPCGRGYNQGDPIVLYDAQVDRWLISDFAFYEDSSRNPIPPYYECLAVSKNGDPVTGGWWRYAYLAHNTLINDYPKLAVWPDAYYMSANMYDVPSDTLKSVKVWALDRNAMLNGAPLAPIYFDLPCEGSCNSDLLPSNLRGTPPPVGAPNYFANVTLPNLIHLWKFHVDWPTPSRSTFSEPTTLTVANFALPPRSVPQLGVSEQLDTIDGRLMMPLQYRNINGSESLWANHTVGSANAAALRWYEIRNPNSSPIVYQQGTFQPDANHRWIGSLAVDRSGNMAVGYSVSSSSMYPAIRYAGRLASDNLNTLAQAETTLIAGTGSQNGGGGRWGDYSSMTVDPADDCTFWYTNEYYETTGNNWQTRIGSFRYSSCGPAVKYDAALDSQSAPLTLAAGLKASAYFKYRNTGTGTWYRDSTNQARLGTLDPDTGAPDYPSPFADSTWINNNRPAVLDESSVAPGGVGTFRFTFSVPASMPPGQYRLRVAPLLELQAWMALGANVYLPITIINAPNRYYMPWLIVPSSS